MSKTPTDIGERESPLPAYQIKFATACSACRVKRTVCCWTLARRYYGKDEIRLCALCLLTQAMKLAGARYEGTKPKAQTLEAKPTAKTRRTWRKFNK